MSLTEKKTEFLFFFFFWNSYFRQLPANYQRKVKRSPYPHVLLRAWETSAAVSRVLIIIHLIFSTMDQFKVSWGTDIPILVSTIHYQKIQQSPGQNTSANFSANLHSFTMIPVEFLGCIISLVYQTAFCPGSEQWKMTPRNIWPVVLTQVENPLVSQNLRVFRISCSFPLWTIMFYFRLHCTDDF